MRTNQLVVALMFFLTSPVFAQDKPGYLISEIQFINKDLYLNEYGPKIRALYKTYGCEIIAGGGNILEVSNISKSPDRIVIAKCQSMNKARAYVESKERADLMPLKEKSAIIRAYVVEGN